MFNFLKKTLKDEDDKQEQELLELTNTKVHHINRNTGAQAITKFKFRVKESSFFGAVLLSEVGFDFEKFTKDLARLWKIDLDEDSIVGVRVDGTHVYRLGGMTVTLRLAETQVSKDDVEFAAARNYMWNDAVQEVREHKAHLHVSVAGEGEANQKGILFTKIVDSCCQQVGVVGVYTNGIVHNPEVYRELADIMVAEDEGPLPILNLVWVGFNKTESGFNIYTTGLRAFGKEEIEIINSDIGVKKLHDSMLEIVTYVLENDITLSEGESINFLEGQLWKIRKSAGVSTDGLSLKLELE